jgi:hypothetical protein
MVKDKINRKKTEEAQGADLERKAKIQAQIQRLEEESAHQFSLYESMRTEQLCRIALLVDGGVS